MIARATLAWLLALALVATVGLGTVAADPVNSRNALLLEITCAEETFQIVTTSGNPGHIIGSTGNIMPVEFTFTNTYTDPETGELVTEEGTFPIGRGNKHGLQDDLVSCTTEAFTFEDPELGEVTTVISVVAFLTPRGR
jgi:hypothetical protein